MSESSSPGHPETPDRREFIANTVRGVAAVSLVGVTWFASVSKGGRNCLKAPICGQCPVFQGCGLPRAQDWRDQEERREV